MQILFIISAIASSLLSALSNYRYILGNPVPGFIFGIFFLVMFQRLTLIKLSWWKWIFFVFISGAAYYLATIVADYTSIWFRGDCQAWGMCPTEYYGGFLMGGFAGAFVLAILIKFLLRTLTWLQVLILIILGGLLGPLGRLFDNFIWGSSTFLFYHFNGYFRELGLYLVWQTGIMAVTMFFVKYNRKLDV